MNRVRYLIIGQGLAGTAVAWHCHWRNLAFTIVDRGDAVTASKIAAGLITPITGKRCASDPNFQEQWSAARAFYERVEIETGSTKILHTLGAVRIWQTAEERNRLESKLQPANTPASLTTALEVPHGAFAIPDAARLDVPRYLDVSRRFFESLGSFKRGSSVSATAKEIVIDCTGIAALREGRVPEERFQPAKGEILTLKIPGLAENRVVHRGVWLARIEGDLYRAGATYTWDVLDDVPTVAGREEIESRVRAFLTLPFTIVAHDAATRPIAKDRTPIMERIGPNRWAFNGLGSKGALFAPYYSLKLLEQLVSIAIV